MIEWRKVTTGKCRKLADVPAGAQIEAVNTETPAAPRNTEEQLVVQAREFVRGIEFALSLVRDSDSIGVNAVLAKCPESYRRGQRDAINAIASYLYPHNTERHAPSGAR
jgi:hypothetical protein